MPKSRIPISECEVGTVLAGDVKSYQGITLVAKDSVLNQYIIGRLIDFGITDVWAYSADTLVSEASINMEGNSSKSRNRNSNNNNNNNNNSSSSKLEMIRQNHAEAVLVIKQVLREISAGGKLNYPEITQLAKLVYGNINNTSVIKYLNNIKDKDEYTYTHCVNVAFYAMLIAKWLNLADEEIDQVIQAGLLHDIGKVLIPDEILNKPGQLLETELDIMKNHALLGYFYLKDLTGVSPSVKEAVLSHHERCDGSGYPYGLNNHEIPLFAKIIAIADVYDAMTQDRIYKKGVNPFVAFEMFQTIGLGMFDIEILPIFLENISSYFTGLNVILEDGGRAEIVYVPPYEITKPVILRGTTFIDINHSNSKILTFTG